VRLSFPPPTTDAWVHSDAVHWPVPAVRERWHLLRLGLARCHALGSECDRCQAVHVVLFGSLASKSRRARSSVTRVRVQTVPTRYSHTRLLLQHHRRTNGKRITATKVRGTVRAGPMRRHATSLLRACATVANRTKRRVTDNMHLAWPC
jgi:hypothetical protein